MSENQHAAVTVLLDVYKHRPDLQAAFPEARTGNHARLFQWARGVCRREWEDPSFPTLHRFEDWYAPQYSLHLRRESNPADAFRTWDQAEESLEDAERRIHDGVPLEMLHERAAKYLETLNLHFPWAMPRPGSTVLEIGSGVAYIMEAACKKFRPAQVVGLDVAPAMAAKARQRLARDQVGIPAEFVIYDGVQIPLRDASLDFVYSVACFQHIPKPYVYNLFSEILRILRPTGFAAIHLLSFTALKLWAGFDLRIEIANQLLGLTTHWHHFYSKEELSRVLEDGYGAGRVTVVDSEDGSIWTSFAPA